MPNKDKLTQDRGLDEILTQAGCIECGGWNLKQEKWKAKADIDAYATNKVVEELESLKGHCLRAFHPLSQGYGQTIPEIEDRIAKYKELET